MSNIANLSHHHFRIPTGDTPMPSSPEGRRGTEPNTAGPRATVSGVSQRRYERCDRLLGRTYRRRQERAGCFMKAPRRRREDVGSLSWPDSSAVERTRLLRMFDLLDLLLLTGKLDGPGCGFAPLAEENNDQERSNGNRHRMPGAHPIADSTDRERIAKQWKAELPTGEEFPHRNVGSSHDGIPAMFIV